MKAFACRIGRKVAPVAMMLPVTLGAGVALADGEPTDLDDLYPQELLCCPLDPEVDLPSAEWMEDGDGGLVVVAVRILVALASS